VVFVPSRDGALGVIGVRQSQSYNGNTISNKYISVDATEVREYCFIINLNRNQILGRLHAK
jgi:hypothetical protein